MTLLDKISYVKRGKNRKKVFLALEDGMMPSEVAKKVFGKTTNTYFNLVSRALGELRDEGLVEVVNPNEKTGRLYKITPLGSKVQKKLP